MKSDIRLKKMDISDVRRDFFGKKKLVKTNKKILKFEYHILNGHSGVSDHFSKTEKIIIF